MIVAGFIEPITKELPLEYAVEMNRLIQLQMEGSRRMTWLEERRQAAAEANAALPVPTIRDEHWRFTNLRGIDFAAYRAPAPSVDAAPRRGGPSSRSATRPAG